MINCATHLLVPMSLDSPIEWDHGAITHLARRISFSGSFDYLNEFTSDDPQALIQQLLDQASNAPLTGAPHWADWTVEDYGDDINEEVTNQLVEFLRAWLRRMYDGTFRDKLTLFWHNHFVTRLDTYQCPSYLWSYYEVIERNALGNFREFVREIGLTPAMLVFLNGVQNTRFEPNENYARELYELFTLGVDNGYTQEDITETARALTGYNDVIVGCGPISFRPAFHDNGEKTIFGQTGDWGYDDVINLLFEERGKEIAVFLSTKLYAQFVNPKLNEDIINEMSEILLANDFDMLPLWQTLLGSEHFFDIANRETIIPGHFELYYTHAKEIGMELGDDLIFAIYGTASELGQRILNPVDVAGWQGNREWINTNSLIRRWSGMVNLINFQFEMNREYFRELALQLTNESNDPVTISKAIVDHFIKTGLDDEETYERALVRFKSEVPENYYEDGSWNLYWDTAPGQVALLIGYLSQLPEYQLK